MEKDCYSWCKPRGMGNLGLLFLYVVKPGNCYHQGTAQTFLWESRCPDGHSALPHSLLFAAWSWVGTEMCYLNPPVTGMTSSRNQSCIILYFCLCSQIKMQLQSEVTSEQDRLLLSPSLFSTVNKSNLNLLSLNIFSEKFTVGYILLHKCLKIKGKTIRKGFYLLFFTVPSLSEIFHMQMLMVCQAHNKQLSFCRCKEIEYLKKLQRVEANERSFSITCKVMENKDIHEPSKTECKAVRLYLV